MFTATVVGLVSGIMFTNHLRYHNPDVGLEAAATDKHNNFIYHHAFAVR